MVLFAAELAAAARLPRDPQLIACSGDSDPAALQMLRALRTRFLQEMNWLPECQWDTDEYDPLPQTLHLAQLDQAGQAVVSFRLTRVEALSASLSYRMLDQAPQVQRQVLDWARDRITPRTRLWDLTRLVRPVSPDCDTVQVVLGVLRLLGLSYAATAVADSEDPLWVFATTTEMRELIRGLGIHPQTVASGRFHPRDAEDSHFCWIDPRRPFADAARDPQQHAFALPAALHGVAQAGHHDFSTLRAAAGIEPSGPQPRVVPIRSGAS